MINDNKQYYAFVFKSTMTSLLFFYTQIKYENKKQLLLGQIIILGSITLKIQYNQFAKQKAVKLKHLFWSLRVPF